MKHEKVIEFDPLTSGATERHAISLVEETELWAAHFIATNGRKPTVSERTEWFIRKGQQLQKALIEAAELLEHPHLKTRM